MLLERKFHNNKKGSALALVIIIVTGLAVMVAALYTIAQSSIVSADSGIKSREAYLSAKSGIEFIKSSVEGTVQSAMNELSRQITTKYSDLYHVITLEDEIYYGYGSFEDGFIMNGGISESSSAYKNAPIKIVYSVEHELSFSEIDESTGACDYTDRITITATSTGKSPQASTFTGILEKGISLSFEYEHEIIRRYYGGTGPEGYIPGTGGNGSPGIPVTDKWPEEESAPGIGGAIMSGGSTFVYEGTTYYVVMYNTWITLGTHPSQYPHILQINPGPSRDITGWEGVPPYNNMSVESFNSWLNQRDGGGPIRKGDKVIYNGIYYIFAYEPSQVSWVQKPPHHPWFIIPNQ